MCVSLRLTQTDIVLYFHFPKHVSALQEFFYTQRKFVGKCVEAVHAEIFKQPDFIVAGDDHLCSAFRR